jgi:ABC-type uncharacterized transport system substrate-binding protein
MVGSRTSRRWFSRIAVVGVLLGWTGSALAHPHVYVAYSVLLDVGPHSIESIGFVFTFDEGFSATARTLVGWGDPASGPEKHARLLEQLPYEVEVTYDGKPVALGPPTDVNASEADGRVRYRFRVPLVTSVLPPGTLEIHVEDYGFYVAFALNPSAPAEVKTSGAGSVTCTRPSKPNGAPGPLRCRYGAAP